MPKKLNKHKGVSMFRRAILAFIFIFTALAFGRNSQGAVNFVIGVPEGDFRENIDRNGYGGGIMFQVWHRKSRAKEARGKIYAVHIDAKALYIAGGEAEYLKEGSIIIHDDATVEYIVSKSKTDLLDIHISVLRLNFSGNRDFGLFHHQSPITEFNIFNA